MEILTVQPLIFPGKNSQYSHPFPKGNTFCVAIFFPSGKQFYIATFTPPLSPDENTTIG